MHCMSAKTAPPQVAVDFNSTAFQNYRKETEFYVNIVHAELDIKTSA